ncbi:deoxyribodipyrimidine photo-lyase [Methylotenera sp.]|uniref:cryptochrome/photolyase family protein n=1 Tax=Methylotenera sp. TaxID=2051956 RepID=UPI0024896425|nr:deoxyribodipyrimidine photo-lyase [Methylotenera sp.]MDI1360469.1 deoxyribodipyrimidine photo-lyase [Methylotenera sp.]
MSQAQQKSTYEKSLVWFRRDLRDYDHAALYHALKSSKNVYCVFVFDTAILSQLNDKADRRVEFIWESVRELKTSLQKHGSDLIVLHGKAGDEIPKLANSLLVNAVFTNHDYEPSAIARDAHVAEQLSINNIAFHHYKDHVIFEKDEVLNLSGKPYGVFTPYKNMWLKTVNDFFFKAYPVDAYLSNLTKLNASQLISLEDLGFKRTNLASMRLPTGMKGGLTLFNDFKERMSRYKDARDFPAIKGVSYLSVHLRFGTISIRHLAREAMQAANTGAQTWLSELIWRDFYVQILHHNPSVAAGKAYKAEFESLKFPNDTALFQAWCDGKTGYPLVDAAMRQLNTTGFMHNRLRMVAASFLVKDLLIDWRWGERYFAEKLIDFDLSANNGGWQWAASTGCDAQPWFRIFNPITQSERFDAQGKFIRKYVPELAKCNDKEIHAPWLIPPLRLQELNLSIGKDYAVPVVDHATQRLQALALYKNI